MNFKCVDQIASWRLCMGCGACISACPNNTIQLIDVCDKGLRPVVDKACCQQCGKCVDVCPGISLSHLGDQTEAGRRSMHEWGPILEVWEGYATDEQFRFRGSSGGLVSALAHFCIQGQNFSGALHTGVCQDDPIKNVPIFSNSYEGLLSGTGSRYSPAGPCEKFDWIEQSEGPCVFIGKPCDIAAYSKYKPSFSTIQQENGVSISIFCAGTPSTEGTLKSLEKMNACRDDLLAFRYRGHGWPGNAHADVRGDGAGVGELTYEECWGDILSRHVQFRCRLCPDSTGEFADISCGDPWYRPRQEGDPGRSLVIARTERGRRIIQQAIEAKYVVLETVEADVIWRSQLSLQNKRRNLWGRLAALKLFRVPVPCYRGFGLFRSWKTLSVKAKFKSLLGTIRRIVQRHWYRPEKS